jgi:glucose dehydrogenase
MATFNPTPFWVKKTLTYADFEAVATTDDASVYTLPIGATVHQVVIKVNTPFTGGSLSTYTISLGVSGTVTKYLAATSVFSGTAITGSTANTAPVSFSGTTDIRAYATGSHNLSTATAGSIDVYALVSVLPI